MAKFRRKAKRSSFGGFRRGAKRANRVSGGLKATDVLIAGAIYGVARPMVADMLPTFFKIGPIDSDNVIIGGAGYLATKKGKGIVKALGVLALGGETAQVASNLLNKTSTASTGSITSSWS